MSTREIKNKNVNMHFNNALEIALFASATASAQKIDKVSQQPLIRRTWFACGTKINVNGTINQDKIIKNKHT